MMILCSVNKSTHLSLNLWKRLSIKGFEHGRDIFDLSHISPVLLMLLGTTL